LTSDFYYVVASEHSHHVGTDSGPGWVVKYVQHVVLIAQAGYVVVRPGNPGSDDTRCHR
jgi:hypothetical protein